MHTIEIDNKSLWKRYNNTFINGYGRFYNLVPSNKDIKKINKDISAYIKSHPYVKNINITITKGNQLVQCDLKPKCIDISKSIEEIDLEEIMSKNDLGYVDFIFSHNNEIITIYTWKDNFVSLAFSEFTVITDISKDIYFQKKLIIQLLPENINNKIIYNITDFYFHNTKHSQTNKIYELKHNDDFLQFIDYIIFSYDLKYQWAYSVQYEKSEKITIIQNI